VRKLWQWRVAWPWYAAAIGVPIAQGLLALGIAAAFGVFHPAPVNTAVLRTILPWASIVFLLAAAEELGWRGYALPNLLSRYNAIVASLILGTLHALWHWPLILLPHMWLSDVPVVPWTTSIIAQAFVFTWIVRGAGGSVLLAALFHAMGNATTVFYGGVEPRWTPWLKCAVAVLTTVVLLAATRRESWKRARQPNSASATGGRDSQDDLDRNERL
jgi:membrane protease YdiL (CAAX protease family)